MSRDSHRFMPERTYGGAYFSDCSCGWSGGVYPSHGDAKRTHATHVTGGPVPDRTNRLALAADLTASETTMSRLTTLLDEIQARCDDAPPAPWRCSDGAYGTPSDGPDHTTLEATHPQHGWVEVATGGYDSWSGHALGFAADARTDLPRLVAALRAVLELHRRVGIYDECDCTDEQKQVGHEDIYEVGLTCNKLYDICAECCRDDIYQTEDCANYHEHKPGERYHCPTIRALDDEDQGHHKLDCGRRP